MRKFLDGGHVSGHRMCRCSRLVHGWLPSLVPTPTTFADPLERVGVLKKEVVHEWVPIQASDHPFNPRRWELHACMHVWLLRK
ncbi:hypothetical protein ACFXTO_013430 [Malus domestica]